MSEKPTYEQLCQRVKELEQEGTARERAEEELRQSHREYRLLVDNMSQLLGVSDIEGNYTSINRAHKRILGYDPEDLLGKNALEFIHPDDVEGLTAAFTVTVERDEAFEARFKCRDGSYKWVELRGTLLTNENGVPEKAFAFGIDITDRKMAQDKLKASEERFRALIENATDAVCLISANGRIIYESPAAERIGGRKNEEKTGNSIMDQLHPDDLAGMAENMSKVLNNPGVAAPPMELRFRHQDGSWRWVEGIGRNLLEDPKIGAIVCNYRDITERKRVEEELLRAKEEAEAGDRAKSEFLANMSHEIRTPMNGVIGMTGLLLEMDLTPRQYDCAGMIQRSADTLLRVINDILDFSKIEAGKLELEPLGFNLRVALEETNDLLALSAHEKGLELVCQVDPDVPSLLQGDPGRLRQVLINLLGNAVKFTSEGEVILKVSLDHEDEKQAAVRFEVTDTGIGVPKGRGDDLFEAFTQADGSSTRRFGGTGLGLSISKQLVEIMGGQIGMESTEGEGSTFWFTVLLDKQPPRTEISEEPLRNIRGEHVLVVDDNSANRHYLEVQLRLQHCRCDQASNGQDALYKLRAAVEAGDPFSLAVLDMQMPEMDGETLGRQIKEDPVLGNTILVMMTSLGWPGDASSLKEKGFSAHLTKPVKQSHLQDCLATALHQGSRPRSQQEEPLITRHSPEKAERSKIRVLIAEDDMVNQQVALRIMEKLGYRADIAANGQLAVRALESTPYDLVLMDVEMPEMNGFEATRTIRDPGSRIVNHEVPVIAMTAYAMKGDRERCIEAGMDDYVSKPIDAKGLKEVIEKWLAQTQTAQPQHPSVPAIRDDKEKAA